MRVIRDSSRHKKRVKPTYTATHVSGTCACPASQRSGAVALRPGGEFHGKPRPAQADAAVGVRRLTEFCHNQSSKGRPLVLSLTTAFSITRTAFKFDKGASAGPAAAQGWMVTQVLPSNCASRSLSKGSKSVGDVLILMPGRSRPGVKSFSAAACLMMFFGLT